MSNLDPIVAEVEPDEPVEAQSATAQWDTAECTCPDWCERDHELD